VKEKTVGLMDWIKKMLAPRPSAAAVAAHTLGRNDLCWCGSGKKYKKCHLSSDAHKRLEEGLATRAAAEFAIRNGAAAPPAPSGKKRKGNRMPEAVQPPVK
jgi:SEC-C motif